MPEVAFSFISLQDDKYIVALHIQRGLYKPYITEEPEGQFHFYIRHGNKKQAMSYGELILSAFLVTTPSIMNYANADSTKRSQEHKKLFYLLLLVGFLELVIYVTIKTNPDNKPSIVYISSALCTVSSVVISWKSELFLKGKV